MDIEQSAKEQEDRNKQSSVQLPGEVMSNESWSLNLPRNFDNSNLLDFYFEDIEEVAEGFALTEGEIKIPENWVLQIPMLLEEKKTFDNEIEEEMAQGPKIKLLSPFSGFCYENAKRLLKLFTRCAKSYCWVPLDITQRVSELLLGTACEWFKGKPNNESTLWSDVKAEFHKLIASIGTPN